jgi:hypothetical protein
MAEILAATAIMQIIVHPFSEVNIQTIKIIVEKISQRIVSIIVKRII